MGNTTAVVLIERLIDWGVDTIFGLPGDGINDIFEALRNNQDRIKFIQVRHEEAAAFAACGYAKFTGRLGVCLATSGPGGIHLLNGLYDARDDGQPVLAITGHTYHDLIGTHYQQDVDLDKLFIDVAAYDERIMGPGHMVNALDEAVKTCLTRRTVSHLTVPKDIQGWDKSNGTRSEANIPKHSKDLFIPPYPLPPDPLLREAADLVNRGSRVAIMAGRGALGCREELIKLAEKTAGVIVKPLLGKAVVPDDSPYTTGGIGLLGTSASQDVIEECDTLLIVGSSFPYLEFYPKPGQAKTIQIDINPDRIGLRTPVEVGLVGNSRDVIAALLPLLEHKTERKFLEKSQKRAADWNKVQDEEGTRMDKPMKPQVVTYALNQVLDRDAIICCDTGTVTTWTARFVKIRDEMMFSASGSLAAMGNGLPYAVGAAVAYPGRQVVAVVGDGGLTMMMGELATVAKYKLPIKIVVIKNNVLGQIKWEQLAFNGNPQYGVELQPIDFALYAKACGVPGYTIDDPMQVLDTMHLAFAQPGPALIEAVVDPNEPPLPGKISTEQALHFMKALARGEKGRFKIIKNVLEDQVREVI